MLDRLKQLQVEALSEVANTTDLKELNDLRVEYLGKKGPIQGLSSMMGSLTIEEKKELFPLRISFRISAISTNGKGFLFILSGSSIKL